MKKIFFNNIGLTCDFAEASYIGIRADNLEPRTYFEARCFRQASTARCRPYMEIAAGAFQNRCAGLAKYVRGGYNWDVATK